MRKSSWKNLPHSGIRGAALVVLAGALIIGSFVTVPAFPGSQTTGSTGAATTGAGTTGAATTGVATTGAATTGAATTGAATTGAATTGTAPTTGTAAAPPATVTAAQVPPTITTVNTPAAVPNIAAGLNIYGRDFFAEARKLVDERRKGSPATPGTANPQTGVVGPESMAGQNVNIPFPDRYQLGPGDTLTVLYSSPVAAAQTADVRVDERGSIIVPQALTRITVRGLTLDQATKTITGELRKYLRDAVVDVRLKELRTISVRILGEAYAPGTYELPSIITLFNALYAAGGPSDIGSLRNILIKRQNGATRKIDFYKLLNKGDANLDVPLQPGDVILIPPAEVRVAVAGEVKRPAIYELLPGEKLREALALAGGTKASAVVQRIAVTSIKPGVERRQIDANLSNSSENPPLFDGDGVEVFSVRDVILNTVSVDGAVDQPRTFQFTKGMRISDLIQLARGTLPNASLERADLIRMNSDGTHTLFPVRLALALKKLASEDRILAPLDRLVVYETKDLQYPGARQVSLKGAVQKPGQYNRPDNMTIRDLLVMGGGLLPTAYNQTGYLQRTNSDGSQGPLVKVDLRSAANGDANSNILLQDYDILTIFTIQETQFVPTQHVEVVGSVQRPGTYALSTGLKLADLVQFAGGPMPDADTTRVFVQRTNENGTIGPLFVVNLSKAIKGDATQNIGLQSRDKVSVFKITETQFYAPQQVDIAGSVPRPGTYPLNTGMKLLDIVALAGGPMPDADQSKVFIQRTNENGTPGPLLIIDLKRAANGEADQNVELQARDKVTFFKITETQFQIPLTVEVVGAVQRQGVYPLATGLRIADVISLAGGPLADADLTKAFLQRTNENGTQGPLLPFSLQAVMDGDQKANLLLTPRDKITIYKLSETQYKVPEQVLINGAVLRPGTYPRANNMKLSALLSLVGGVTPNASDTLELSHAWAKLGSPVTRIKLSDVTAGRPEADIQLQPGDSITIPLRSDVQLTPRIVNILGAVKFPGPYMLTGSNDKLAYLVQRAGGLTDKAFTEGAQFVRDPKYLTTEYQRSVGPKIISTFKQVAEDEYLRAAARADVDRLRIVFSSGGSINSGSTASILPSVGATGTTTSGSVTPGISMDQAMAKALGGQAATKARDLADKDIIPAGNLNVDMSAALRRPGSNKDVALQDGDVIIVPERPTTVTVSGAVVLPSSVVFSASKGFDYYIERAGGLSADSSVNQTIIIRATGAIVRYKRGVKILLGDTILVPTKVMAVKLSQSPDPVATITQTVTSAGITLALIHSLLK